MITRTERELNELRGQISDKTGFDNGAEFVDEAEVRAYFTTEAMEEMFGADNANQPAQAELDRMAAAVIENRWHCEF